MLNERKDNGGEKVRGKRAVGKKGKTISAHRGGWPIVPVPNGEKEKWAAVKRKKNGPRPALIGGGNCPLAVGGQLAENPRIKGD